MKNVDQVARGLAMYFDENVRPTMSGNKSILYGVAIGMALSHPDRLIGRYGGVLEAIGVMDNKMIDTDSLAAEIRKQMLKGDGSICIHILGDEFIFHTTDIDQIMSCIERS